MNIPSFEVFEQLVKGAIKVEEGKVKDIQILRGITDFDAMFKLSIPKDVQGKNNLKNFMI